MDIAPERNLSFQPLKGNCLEGLARRVHGLELGDLALLHRINTRSFEQLGLITKAPCCVQAHFGVAAQGHQLFFANEGVLVKPALGAVGIDLQVHAAGI